MSARDPLDELALDSLYGLLDPADAAKLETPAGQAALERAKHVQALLAAAAKSQFPDVRFAPPATEPARAKPRLTRRLVGWCAAVAVLLAVATPLTLNAVETLRIKAVLAEREHFLAEANAELTQFQAARNAKLVAAADELQRSTQTLAQRQMLLRRDLARAETDLRAKQLSLSISGPAALTAGATNDYRVLAVDGRNQPTTVTLSARVRDQNGTVVYEDKLGQPATNWTLKLPADLPLTPKRELFLELDAKAESGIKSELRERLQLATPQYVTQLTTDKPMYQPGETVHFRSLTLDRLKLQPPAEEFHLYYVVRDPQQAETAVTNGRAVLAGGDGKLLNGPDGQPVRGVGAGSWTIPETAGGGEWSLAVRDPQNRFPEEKRTFLVNKYQPARLNKELEWAKKSFGPGEVAVANCKVTRAEGGPVANQPVVVEARVDDSPISVATPLKTDAEGRVSVRFGLPAIVDKGVASLSLTFTDGGSVETLVKPIPLVLKKYAIDFYPEGGELVAGAPNRVYFQVRSTLGKPADLKGRIVDAGGQTVAAAATLNDEKEAGINQGQGRAEFTPEFGQSYKLVIDEPANWDGIYRLPVVKADGVVLTALDPVSTETQPLRVRVASAGAARSLFVGAYGRGRMLDHQRVRVAANESAEVSLKPEGGLGGVTRVTVFEETGSDPRPTLRPLAERLVYRQPTAKLNLALKPKRDRYAPGERVEYEVRATNEGKEPTSAVVALGVVNQSVVTMADEKTAKSLPTFVYLTSEVRTPEEMEHADVLLGDHPKAATALDLLLGTQGWRRFVEARAGDKRKGAVNDVALVARSPVPVSTVERTSLQLEQKRVLASMEPEVVAATDEVTRATEAMESVQADPAFATEDQLKQATVSAATQAVGAARSLLEAAVLARRWWLEHLLPVAALATFALGLAVVVLTLGRSSRGAWVGGAGLVTAAVGGIVCLQLWRGNEVRERTAATAAPGAKWAAEALADEARGGGGAVEFKMAKAEAPPPAMPVPLADTPAEPGAAPLNVNGRWPFREANDKLAAAPRPVAVAAPAPADRPAGPVADQPERKLKEMAKDAKGDGEKKEVERLKKLDDLADGQKQLGALQAKDNRGVNRVAPVADPNKAEKEVAGFLRAGGMGGRGFGGPGGGPAGGMRKPGVIGGDVSDVLVEEIFRIGGDGKPAVAPFVVREYAHRHSPNLTEARNDFAETLYWHPALVVPKDGATFGFDLADAVTRYRVLAIGHTANGRLGELSSQLEVRKPISLEPKLPVELTAGDTLGVALTVANDTDKQRQVAVAAETKGLALVDGLATQQLDLAPQQRGRSVYRFRPNIVEGRAELRFTGETESGSDAYVAKLPVVPEGFPTQGAASDELERIARHDVTLPETWVRGTLKCQLDVFPSTLAELQKGLEGLMGEPGGCFEQTSTNNYPNALVLQYLNESNQANPDVMRNARAMLTRGYAKLTSFEVSAQPRREGFEWFGQSPAHEALTAYGLMQFKDMARVTDVDPVLIERTRSYLLSRRDGKGGFTRNPLALDSFGRAPDDVTNAYIVWAVTEAGNGDDIAPELDAAAAKAKTATDPYLRALVANALLNKGRSAEGVAILKELAAKLSPDGALRGAATSITGSGGASLDIETTALAVLGWLKANRPSDFSAATRSAVGWIGKQRGGSGGFGATQSTILALKALIEHTRTNKQTPEAGTVSLFRGAQLVGRLDYPAGAQGVLSIPVPDVEGTLKPGRNELRAEITGKNTYPYTLSWSYQTQQPPSAANCAVRLTTALDRTTFDEGGTARLRVKLENVSGKGQGMAVAVVGLPAGMKLPDDFKQLRDMKALRDGKAGPIGSFEVRGRELVLYWRDLAPDAKIDLSIDVIAHVPGEYRGPASRAYLYYTPELKHWVAPLWATINASR